MFLTILLIFVNVDNDGIIPPPSQLKEYSYHQAVYCIGNTGFVAFNNANPEVEFVREVDVSIILLFIIKR